MSLPTMSYIYRVAFAIIIVFVGIVNSQVCQNGESPCANGGTCIGGQIGSTYTCQCTFRWQGRNCSKAIPPRQNCGYNQFGDTGSITSPNYPDVYDNDHECYYYVRVHNARRITFYVRFFETEIYKDYMEYGNGYYYNHSDAVILEGNFTNTQFTIEGGNAWFYFYSDFNVRRKGYNIVYEAETVNCDSMPCENGGICITLDYDFTCECLFGFEGRTCEIDINECDPNPCNSWEICTEGIGKYTCACPKGFVGEGCRDICQYGEFQCENGGRCIGGQIGSTYTCQCTFGWEGRNCSELIPRRQNCGYNQFGDTGSITSPNYPDVYDNDHECYYYVRVHNARRITFYVQFFETEIYKDYMEYGNGYYYNPSDAVILEGNFTNTQFTIEGGNAWFYFYSDFNVRRKGYHIVYEAETVNCDSMPCENGGKCITLDYDFTCECLFGFEGRTCEIDINECDPKCNSGELCTNGTCTCPNGFFGEECRDRTIEVVGGDRICFQAEDDSSMESLERAACPIVTTAAPAPTTAHMTTIRTSESKLTTNGCIKPSECPTVYDPVCGTDGVTYPNLCYLLVIKCRTDPKITFTLGECLRNEMP
ncbi:fibropellin-3-like isoform X2 [Anneissia japonica]|uniref:fibropellin-3-like isoform X2 n=1 Tax=Anneissia japonica TaxID=1529436 RepID=UPI0014259F02|nr:fibropellin-3-like isoform X2 [Anneissia japonica]